MKPVQFHDQTNVLTAEGCEPLPCRIEHRDGMLCTVSYWQMSLDEAKEIIEAAKKIAALEQDALAIELAVYAPVPPPVSLAVATLNYCSLEEHEQQKREKEGEQDES